MYVQHYQIQIYQGWPEYYLNRFMSSDRLYDETTADASLAALISKMQICSYSTAFSGIDSPGTAFAQLRVAAQELSGNIVLDPEHLHAIVS